MIGNYGSFLLGAVDPLISVIIAVAALAIGFVVGYVFLSLIPAKKLGKAKDTA